MRLVNKTLSVACVAAAAVSVVMLQGCATNIKASSTSNPAPAEAFSRFGRITLKPVVFKDGYSGDQAGLNKINENIQKDLAEPLKTWNARPANGRTLVIEPVVEELSFKHGAKRVLLGPLAGSSGVLMRVNIKDANGRLVASPEFFQRAQAMGAGFTMGIHDNLMLTRVANLASAYVMKNFERPVGGPTGADDQSVTPR